MGATWRSLAKWRGRATTTTHRLPGVPPRVAVVRFLASERVALAWQADDLSVAYSYPGLTAALQPAPFTPNVAAIKVAVEKLIGVTFNSCHLNLYRCGADHVSWHTDEDCDLCVRLGSHHALPLVRNP